MEKSIVFTQDLIEKLDQIYIHLRESHVLEDQMLIVDYFYELIYNSIADISNDGVILEEGWSEIN